MKNFTLTCLVVLLSFSLSAQEGAILTEQQNSAWITELRQEKELDEQLEQLRNRFNSDKTIYFRTNSNPHGKDPAPEKEYEAETAHRPLYIFSFPGGRLPVNSNPSQEYLSSLQELLQPEHVIAVNITTGAKATAIYGARAISGLIEIEVQSREVLKSLETAP